MGKPIAEMQKCLNELRLDSLGPGENRTTVHSSVCYPFGKY